MKTGWLLLPFIVIACSGPIQLTSDVAGDSMVIDGQDDEWGTGLTQIEDQGILFGVRNDRDFLYLCIVPMERSVGMHILMQGMTVWFDPAGGKKKVLGVRFPLPGGGMIMPGGPLDGRDRTKTDRQDEFDRRMRERLGEYEIVGPGRDDRRRFAAGDDKNLTVQLGMGERGPVYELRIPLVSSQDRNYAINPKAGGVIGIGIEGADKKMSAPPQGGAQRGGGGRMPGGGMAGGHRGPGTRLDMKPLKWWTTVRLSTRTASGSGQN